MSSKRSAPGVAKDVGLAGTDEVEADVDAALPPEHGHRYPTILLSIVAAAARAATLRLVPPRRSL